MEHDPTPRARIGVGSFASGSSSWGASSLSLDIQAGTSMRSPGLQFDKPKALNTPPRMACLLVGDC